MALKRGKDKRAETEEAEDQEVGQPSSPISVEVVPSAGDAFMFSVFRWSDGKTGLSIKVWVEPRTNETIEQASDRAIKLGVRKLREAEEALAKG